MGVIVRAVSVFAALIVAALLSEYLERRMTLESVVSVGSPAASPRGATPPHPDAWLYPAGPCVALIGVLLAMIALPFSGTLVGADLGIGAFYFIVVVDYVVVGVALAGWGANVAHAVEACYRIVAQMISYVVPLGLAYVGALMMARSLSTEQIVHAQSGRWFIVLQPLGFVLYVVTGLMECYRRPFSEPFSSRIGHGVLGHAPGWMGIVWRIALSGLLFVVAAMGSVLYLGGWLGPVLPGPVWFLLKTYALMALMLYLGHKVPPMSVAQMLSLSWRYLIPIGMTNVLVVGVLILLGVGPR